MLRVGLTGGIGSGKSTVAAALAARGAVVVDSDRVARQVVEPGTPTLDAVVGRFGPSALGADGRLDRPGLAAVVFADRAALADLEAITHPAIRCTMRAEARRWEGTDRIVVLDVALLDAAGVDAYGMELVIVVDVPEEVAVARLVAGRGFTEADAEARVAAQITRAERLGLADIVVDNTGDRDHLDRRVDQVWARLLARAAAGRGSPSG